MKFHPRVSSARAFAQTIKRETVVLVLAVLATIIASIFSGATQSVFRSSELRFADASPNGINIIPASCPSDPHYSGECSVVPAPPAPQGYCLISSSPTYVNSGDSSTLSWSVSDGSATYLGVTYAAQPTNITLTSVGPVSRSGSTMVSPNQTTTYTLSGNYTYLGMTSGSFSCAATVNVVQTCPAGKVFIHGQCVDSCPAGQHAGGGICLCDDTNYVPNSQGQCTVQQCPDGYQWINGQCVAVSQCQLPTTCADDTHVLNQCTGAALDCAASYGAGWYCQAGACRRPAPPIASISAVPSLVPPNRTTNVAWTSSNTSSCTVTATNGDGGASDPWTGKNGSHISSPITAQTTYTLRCRGLDNSTITKTAVVNIIPNWQEQ